MLTGLKIHTDNDILQVPEAPESYNTGDFLADILRNGGHRYLRQDWALRDSPAGGNLDPHRTLQENGVGNDHDLYLVSTVQVRAHTLELEILAPKGATLKCEASSSITASAFLAQLVGHFHLSELDEHGRPNRWNLVQVKTNTTLDPKRILSDNGIATGDRLSIEATPYETISVTISSPSGGSYQPEVLEEILAGELLTSAITHFSLPLISGTEKPIDWFLVRKGTGVRLESTKSLAENGLDTGDQLAIERDIEPPLALSLILAGGKVVNVESLAEALAGDFLNTVVGSLRLDRFNKRGRPNTWLLVDTRTKRPLDSKKNLLENGIKSGDQLWLILEIAELGLEVVAPNGAVISRTEPGDTLGAILHQELVDGIPLPKTDARGRAIPWELRRNSTGKLIDLKKNLIENGLADGDRLVIQGKKRGIWERFQEWFEKNRKMVLLLLAGLAGVVLLGLAGVQFGPEIRQAIKKIFPPPPASGVVQANPRDAKLTAGQTMQFENKPASGDAAKVSWSMPPPQIGTLTPDGLYTAPSPIEKEQLVTIVATSVDDPKKSDKAEVTLLPPPITVSPEATSLGPSGTTQFLANTRPDVGPAVTWSLSPSTPDPGTITPEGLYSAPKFISGPQTVTVTATSQNNPQFIGTATLSLSSSPPPHLAPGAVNLIASQTKQFTLQPNPGGTVQWSIHPAVGSISSSGLYTAPSVVPVGPRVRVTATMSVADASGKPLTASAWANLQPVAVGAVTCTPDGHHKYTCQATAKNTPNTAVLWSRSPEIGSITPQGIYTAPSHVKDGETVTITAASQADPTQTNKLILQLATTPQVTVAIKPHPPTLEAGQNLQFAATVEGANTRSVTWSASGGGIMMPGGLYEAPAVVHGNGVTVHIIATSNADSEAQANTEITVLPRSPNPGPKSGTVTWKGHIDRNKVLTIVDNVPNSGKIDGMFPGVPITVTLRTADCTVQMLPSGLNGWKSIQIAIQKKQTTISIDWQVIAH
jgi:uncharacterized ubiquitin-like protein YukD